MLVENSKKRIFVADDSKDFLSIMQSILEFAGFLVETSEDAEEALDQIQKLQYDLLVLGVVMPRVDGIRLLHMVRNSKQYAAVPVIFITGASNKKVMETHLRETDTKAEGYIRKPFKNKAFLEMLTALLGKPKEGGAQYN
ncbi:MAG: response regulator [Candidatus Abyssobacteria bacterium SURF_5]|uniref:Response regulator n=1 Tax=Abyssobacteria bacterium (strain SURF_5) TaxID=2093360 RepID=A0A3A4NDH8_ABYX5|nr:MAG: response regulator [Candidatus Abyssubacteria bacterium SURF_5]